MVKNRNTLTDILDELKKTQGDQFLLVIGPNGNGSLNILNNPSVSGKKYTNIIFHNIESLMKSPGTIH